MTLSLKLGLPGSQRGGSSGAAGLSFVTSMTVLGDITVNNTTAGASSVTMPFNGWALRIATNLGAVSSCTPASCVLTVTDYGWATDGSQTSWTRTITGHARPRKTSPDGTHTTDEDQAVGVVEITLDQQLYNSAITDVSSRVYKTAITDITFAAGFINGSSVAGSLSAAQLAAITRSDSKDYANPIWKNVSYPNFLMSASTYTVEWSAAHEWAQQGQQLACLEAWARVSGTDGTIARASSMTESAYTAAGDVPRGTLPTAFGAAKMHHAVYSTTISGAGLADGLQGSIRSTAKPWIGPAVNSYDTGVGDTGGYSFNLMADMPFIKDVSTGKYFEIHTWVNQDGTGLLGTNPAGVSTGTSDPGAALSYQTILQAELAIEAYYQALTGGKAHSDMDCGVIHLRAVAGSVALADETTAYSHYTGTGFTYTFGTVLSHIRIEGPSSGPTLGCRISYKKFDGTALTNANRTIGSTKVHYKNITFDATGAAGANGFCILPRILNSNSIGTGADTAYTILEDCDVYGNNVDAAVANGNVVWAYRTRFNNTGTPFGFANVTGQAVSIGCSYYGVATPDQSHVAACYSANKGPNGPSAKTSGPTCKAPMMFNSYWEGNGDVNGITFHGVDGIPQISLGLAFIGCIVKNWGYGSRSMWLGADVTKAPYKNVIWQHHSLPGQGAGTGPRVNMVYNSWGFVAVVKEISMKFSALAHSATKESYFAGEALSGGATHNSSNTYYQGDYVFTSGTITTGPVYQAIRDVPAGILISDTTYWYSAGTWGAAITNAQPRRSGNRRWRLQANCLGNVNGGSVQGTGDDTVPDYDSWLSEARCPGSGTDWGAATIANYFVDDDTTLTVGLGGYRPNLAGPLMNKVPVGKTVMPFDMLGTARLNDGTGAAGALEHL
jgi:hypothetical protein